MSAVPHLVDVVVVVVVVDVVVVVVVVDVVLRRPNKLKSAGHTATHDSAVIYNRLL